MALDKLVDSAQLDGYFTDIADAIRAKTGKSAAMTPAQMVTEIEGIETGGGGGGATTFTGTIELTNEDVQSLTIPVDVTSYSNFRLWLIAERTGLVSDGAVSYYDELQIPSVFSSLSFVPKFFAHYPEPTFQIKRDDSALSTITNIGGLSYLYGSFGRNLFGITVANTPSFNTSGITAQTYNGARKFCIAGAYVKFSYKVEAW